MYSRLRYNDDNDCDVRVKRNFVCVFVYVCMCIYVCVGFQESSFLIICARTAEDYDEDDDEDDKKMTTAIAAAAAASSCSFSLYCLSLSLLMLCHPRLDQRTDRRRKKEEI
jgi:hypothetical protein